MINISAGYWTWWLAAVALAGMEIAIPGASLIWVGAAAAVVGWVVFFDPGMGTEMQFLVFALTTLATVGVARVLARRLGDNADTSHPFLNRRSEQYIGTVHRLDTPIVAGSGRAHIDDSSWSVTGPDLPAGTHVRVIAVDGAVLKVEEVKENAPIR